MQAALTQAIEAYRHQVFLDGLADDFARLKSAPEAWAEEQGERCAWDQTLGDGGEA
jgi:hypothetical protein